MKSLGGMLLALGGVIAASVGLAAQSAWGADRPIGKAESKAYSKAYSEALIHYPGSSDELLWHTRSN